MAGCVPSAVYGGFARLPQRAPRNGVLVEAGKSGRMPGSISFVDTRVWRRHLTAASARFA
jgi:hypothetical protein